MLLTENSQMSESVLVILWTLLKLILILVVDNTISGEIIFLVPIYPFVTFLYRGGERDNNSQSGLVGS